jgi:capsular exopolysaccharide synthesis family protein
VDLRDYVRILRKSWASILAFVVVGIGAGVGLTLATTKVYEASAQLYVYVPASSIDTLGSGATYAQTQVQSLTTYATNDKVLDGAIKAAQQASPNDLGDYSSSQLKVNVSADAPLNKTLINLHVTDTNATRAALLANTLAQKMSKYLPSTVLKDAQGRSVITVNIPHFATVPSSPVTPNKVLNIGLGLVVGLLIGVGVAVLREVLDNTIKGPSDFEEMGLAVLGLVPFDKRTPRSPIAFRSDPHSGRSEAYRQMRTNLQFVDVDNPPRIIAVTSAIPGEGKTTTAINLAAALAEAGARVCLVEADLRRPSIAKALGLVGDVGFTTVVIGKAPVETVLQNAGRNLAVLTSGPIPPNPSELLISQHARQVIADLSRNVDFTIIDTPPLLPVTDGAEMATVADATLLVHRASKTTRDQAARSIKALDKVGRRPVGVILNMITRTAGRYDYEYSYYYTAYRPDRSGDGKRGAHHVDGDSSPTSSNGTAVNGYAAGHNGDGPEPSKASPFDGAAGSPHRSGRDLEL